MKKMILLTITLLGFTIAVFSQNIGGGGEANPNLKTHIGMLQKWQEIRFGMFIHWGPVSMRGTEIGWSRGREIPIPEYDNLYKEFNPALFDAREWVSIAKEAGMKYLIITSKHHDGFCIWDSKYTDYDMMSTPLKRDILEELSAECKKQDILFGTYHSIADWHHPHYTTRYGGDPRPVEQSDMEQYVDYLKNQVRELITNYGTNILWFDGEWEDSWDHEKGMDLYRYVRDLRGSVLINNRVDKGRKGMHGMSVSNKFAGDFGTPEQRVGAFDIEHPWESCITICQQWAWKPNDRMKSLRECIQTLAKTAGGGGNLLLNVGPMLDGRIEQRQIDRLIEIGKWLKKNGESIYGTQGGPFKPTTWMVSTRKENHIYLHLFAWPEKQLILPKIEDVSIISAQVLHGANLNIHEKDRKTYVQLPEKPVDLNNTVIVLLLNKKASLIKPLEVTGNILTTIHHFNLKIQTDPNSKYPAKGLESLTDQIRGSNNFNDGHWLGFEEADFEVDVDLLVEKSIKNVSLGCLQNQNSWIFLPEKVEVSSSTDGKIFTKVNEKKIGIKNETGVKIENISFPFQNLKSRFIKIKATNISKCPDWHKGAGGKAWLFVDEVVVE